jgi:DMSO/TMAO reductase YedYZ molybdopterin-dependent catalytic subunit
MALFDSINQLDESRRGTTRRRFLWSGAAAVAGYLGYRWWKRLPQAIAQRQTRYITPNREFYSVAIDSRFAPRLERGEWRLEINGLSGSGYALSYDQLLSLERRRIYKTFMCIETEPGGESIGNAEWTVTPLAPLLARVLDERRGDVGEVPSLTNTGGGSSRAGRRVVFRALDGFYSSVPLAVALSEQAFIAYEMNGVTLPVKHGYPARLLLPGKYGMKQPRWLQRIEITDRAETGYWEKRGWSDQCDVKMTARIDAAVARADGAWLVTGIAYCGAQPVGAVELSADDGASWQPARLTSERQPNAWATWEYVWQPARAGRHTLAARVSDAAGAKQITSHSGAYPSGATGLHRGTLTV